MISNLNRKRECALNNIIIEKVWNDSDMMELHIVAESEFVRAHQTCYIQETDLHEIGHKMINYVSEYGNQDLYVELGKKEGNFTPAFSMYFTKNELSGHINIEVDLEVPDIEDRSHRFKYYVQGEIGAIERLGKGLLRIVTSDVGTMCSLYETY